MKVLLHPFTFLFALALASCSSESSDSTDDTTGTENDTSTVEVVSEEIKGEEAVATEAPKRPKLTWSDVDETFYIIALNAFEDQDEAIAWVEEREETGHKVGYLWIPDFESLSGTEKYAVFYGPYEHDECYNEVEVLRNGDEPGAYGLGIDMDGNRLEFRGWDNTKYNGKKVDAITESTPKIVFVFDPYPEEEASEDWGWFASKVQEFCEDQDLYVEGAYRNLDAVEIEVVDGELLTFDLSDFKSEGRGYVMINGYKKGFASHDMPDGVKARITDFFGLEIEEEDEGM